LTISAYLKLGETCFYGSTPLVDLSSLGNIFRLLKSSLVAKTKLFSMTYLPIPSSDGIESRNTVGIKNYV